MLIERLGRHVDELESAGSFEPGAIGCGLEEGIDLSTEKAMMADLEALAETCLQQLVRFLRAAAFVSEVPVQLAEPGARMVAPSVSETERKLSSAIAAVAGLGAILQQEPFFGGSESVPARLRRMLKAALQGRTVADVVSAGDRLEGAFLTLLSSTRSEKLRSEIAKSQDRTSRQPAPAPNWPNLRIRDLQADIERIDRRLALLQPDAPGGD